MIVDLAAADRWQAIEELVGNLVATGKIKPENKEPITAAVKKRDLSMSTGIVYGIGLPHASTDLISEVVFAIGRSKNGINFDAFDGKPVHKVIFFSCSCRTVSKAYQCSG